MSKVGRLAPLALTPVWAVVTLWTVFVVQAAAYGTTLGPFFAQNYSGSTAQIAFFTFIWLVVVGLLLLWQRGVSTATGVGSMQRLVGSVLTGMGVISMSAIFLWLIVDVALHNYIPVGFDKPVFGYLDTVLIAVAAFMVGVAVYWIGSRRAARSRRQ